MLAGPRRLRPDLVVLTSTAAEHVAANADAIADLARTAPVALGGAGATAELAARTGARLLDTDPVTAAQRLPTPGAPRRSGRR
jgi:hypothetical protein